MSVWIEFQRWTNGHICLPLKWWGIHIRNYLDTQFLMRRNADNQLDKLHAALSDIPEQRMLPRCVGRSNTNLWSFEQLQRGKGEYNVSLKIGSCGHHSNRSKGNKMGYLKGYEVNVENILWQSYPRWNIYNRRRK